MFSLFQVGRWALTIPVVLMAALQPGELAHPSAIQHEANTYTAISVSHMLSGESAELSSQLPQPAPAPRNRLQTSDGALDVWVGVYSDCSGMTAVGRQGSYIDTCLGGRLYFIAHNPGPFTPLRSMGVGSEITYFDASGLPHNWRIVQSRTWSRWSGSPPLATSDVVAQFQTCITLDGNWDQILDAVPA